MSNTRKLGRKTSADDVLTGVDLAGRSVLVTGANAGIGFETARSLAAHGARVLLGCRSDAKADDTAARIRAAHPDADVVPTRLDLGSLADVRRCCDALEVDSLAAVVCNAGVYGGPYAETADGFERTVGVCHIGHFLLVHLLRSRLAKDGGGRVVMVASGSHKHPARLNFDRLPLPPEKYMDMVAYGQAKLCNVLFAFELNRRWASDGITGTALHPGAMIATEITRSTLAGRLLFKLVRPFTKSIGQGAATSVYCATAPELEGVGGTYYVDCREAKASAEARDPGVAARLWKLSEGWAGV